MKVRVPQELHLPIQLLWFYQDEIAVIIISYLFGMLIGGWFWLVLFVGPYLYIKVKRNNPRGYLAHTLLDIGLTKLDGYPSNYYREYYE